MVIARRRDSNRTRCGRDILRAFADLRHGLWRRFFARFGFFFGLGRLFRFFFLGFGFFFGLFGFFFFRRGRQFFFDFDWRDFFFYDGFRFRLRFGFWLRFWWRWRGRFGRRWWCGGVFFFGDVLQRFPSEDVFYCNGCGAPALVEIPSAAKERGVYGERKAKGRRASRPAVSGHVISPLVRRVRRRGIFCLSAFLGFL